MFFDLLQIFIGSRSSYKFSKIISPQLTSDSEQDARWAPGYFPFQLSHSYFSYLTILVISN